MSHHRLFDKQLAKARTADGQIDVELLGELVSRAYEEADQDRRRTQRSISLMIDELDKMSGRDRELLLTELKVQNARFVAALENMSHALSMFDAEQRLIVCNKHYIDMYRMPPELSRPGTPLAEIMAHRIRHGFIPQGDPENYVSDTLELAGVRSPALKVWELQDGRVLAVSVRPMPDGGWVATHLDITDQRRAEARISHMARHDALTDLPNRLLLRETLQQTLRKRDQQVGLLCLDLDHFKDVNDTLGHPVGDDLLVAVANRLRRVRRDGDLVARPGGDEFVIVQAEGPQPAAAKALAERVIEALGTPFMIKGHQLVVGCSVGVAVFPGDGLDPDQLLRSADIALYRAKADGRGGLRFFEPSMDEHIKARRTLEMDLRRGLKRDEFELFYQPILDIQSRAITGIEALLRWRHPRRGMVPPLDFIPLAEEIGLIVPIGEWVMREACREAATWPDQIPVAVNLSAVQFQARRGLMPVVSSALAASGLDPRRLMLEITETVLMQQSDETLEALHRLRSLGVRICMDDFGTGYSSLSYLRRFPFDKIKIDKSFIRDYPAAAAESISIVRAVAALGAGLGMVTTAEGVETDEQLHMLSEQGCREAQGFLVSPPVPSAGLPELIARLQAAAVSPRTLIRAVS